MKAPAPRSWWKDLFIREPPFSRETRDAMAAVIVEGADLNVNFIALILASCAIATFGLLENSSAVIIGAMIIAPLMGAIQAIAYGALEGDAATFWRAGVTLAGGVLAAIVLSAALALSIGLSDFGNEILSRIRPNLLDLGIALAAGAIGAFARIRPSIASTVAGTAIAVALMPPLCVVGIGIAAREWQISRGAGLLFATNQLGITLTSMVVFLISGLSHRHAAAALAWTGALTAAIVVPLGFSFQTLVREAAIEHALSEALVKQTVTFRQATLVSSKFDWLQHPPIATLLVRAGVVPSPHQVALLEAFAQRVTGQKFRLVLDVAQTRRVMSSGLQQGASTDVEPAFPAVGPKLH